MVMQVHISDFPEDHFEQVRLAYVRWCEKHHVRPNNTTSAVGYWALSRMFELLQSDAAATTPAAQS